jgi:hypothetical protein
MPALFCNFEQMKIKAENIGARVYIKALNAMHTVTENSVMLLWHNGNFEMFENDTPTRKSSQQGSDDLSGTSSTTVHDDGTERPKTRGRKRKLD